MEKIIERNVPIAEENVTLSGQPATNMFEDWSENITLIPQHYYKIFFLST